MSSAEILEILYYGITPGICGGVLNALLVHGGFALPFLEQRDNGRTWFVPAFLGNLAIGAAAGGIGFCLAPDDTGHKRLLALCLLSGTAGGNFIASLMQRHNLLEQEKTTEFLKNNLEKVLKAKGRERSKRQKRELQQQAAKPSGVENPSE